MDKRTIVRRLAKVGITISKVTRSTNHTIVTLIDSDLDYTWYDYHKAPDWAAIYDSYLQYIIAVKQEYLHTVAAGREYMRCVPNVPRYITFWYNDVCYAKALYLYRNSVDNSM